MISILVLGQFLWRHKKLVLLVLLLLIGLILRLSFFLSCVRLILVFHFILVVLIENEFLELNVKVMRQLDPWGEDIQLYLIVNSPWCLKDIDEIIFKSTLNHCPCWTLRISRVCVMNRVIDRVKNPSIVVAIQKVLDSNLFNIKVLLGPPIWVNQALTPNAFNIHRWELFVFIE